MRTPSSPVRERVKEGEREIERQREREGGRENCPQMLFIKGMTGALAPFSFLVLQ